MPDIKTPCVIVDHNQHVAILLSVSPRGRAKYIKLVVGKSYTVKESTIESLMLTHTVADDYPPERAAQMLAGFAAYAGATQAALDALNDLWPLQPTIADQARAKSAARSEQLRLSLDRSEKSKQVRQTPIRRVKSKRRP